MEASTAVLSRPAVSPDGRYIVSSHGTQQRSHVLKVWDSRSGRCVSESWLSQWTTKYPLRSMSWHPTQHMLAIASLGPGATVTVLYAEKEHTHSLAKRLVPSFFNSSPVGRKHGESYDNTSDAGSVASVRFQGNNTSPIRVCNDCDGYSRHWWDESSIAHDRRVSCVESQRSQHVLQTLWKCTRLRQRIGNSVANRRHYHSFRQSPVRSFIPFSRFPL